jgi:hypothetical protein
MVDDEPMHPWPRPARTRLDEPPRVGVVAVNYNTRHLVARLLFGLRCVLAPGAIQAVVVVDNASTDGSRALLGALGAAGLIEPILNDRQRYHGPGLTQGVNRLAAQQAYGTVDLHLIWVLDTDVSILRADALSAAAAALAEAGAVLAGEPDDGDAHGPQPTEQLVALNSLLFDPAAVWQPGHRPFLEGGDPARHLQHDVAAHGQRVLSFPFRSQGYLVHHGRATLAEVARSGETTNQYYRWAVDHQEPHFGLHPHGSTLAAAFEAAYRQAVGDDSDASIVRVLLHAEQVTIERGTPNV